MASESETPCCLIAVNKFRFGLVLCITVQQLVALHLVVCIENRLSRQICFQGVDHLSAWDLLNAVSTNVIMLVQHLLKARFCAVDLEPHRAVEILKINA